MSNVWGISSTRDEDDIVEWSARHMLEECDHVLIEDHLSVDDTPEILARLAAEFPERLHVVQNLDPTFDQERFENALADRARGMGAEWIVPFDTDELWVTTTGQRLCEALPPLAADHVAAVVWEHFPTPHDAGPNPFVAMPWRSGTKWAWDKVAIKGDYIHLSIGHHCAFGGRVPQMYGFEMHHFPWRSRTQARARVARNAALPNGTTTDNNDNYKGLDHDLSDPATFEQWWAGLTHVDGIVRDPVRLRGCG